MGFRHLQKTILVNPFEELTFFATELDHHRNGVVGAVDSAQKTTLTVALIYGNSSTVNHAQYICWANIHTYPATGAPVAHMDVVRDTHFKSGSTISKKGCGVRSASV